MRSKFILSISLGGLWMIISTFIAAAWAQEVSYILPSIYVWWVIIGIALLPGFMMSTMFFSNLLHRKLKKYPDVAEDTTIIMCAHNEEKMQNCAPASRSLDYVYCGRKGKSHALNYGLAMICTPHFLTVDADTCLEKRAVQNIMNHIVFRNSACVAGNLFVRNPRASLAARMQNYDYLLSIAAVKRFQGSYRSALVAQGAFSAYRTRDVQKTGGWRDVMGEDIVLTYQLLRQKLPSTYEPRAVGYTRVPETLNGLYNQRKRWAIGMLEGLSAVPPWKQGTAYSRYFVSMNLCVIYLDFAFLFGLVPGIILAFGGYYYFVGFLTLFAIAVCILLYFSMYCYQKKLGIPFENSILGFICFLLFFQLIQSTASLQGYVSRLLRKKEVWK